MNIVICDDETAALHSIVSCIKKLNQPDFRITTVDNAQRLFTCLEDNADTDILILDINLGDDNGIDIAKKIKAEYPDMPIIFITGYIDFAGDIFEADPIYLLLKPVEPQKLKLALDKACSQIAKRNHLSIQISSKGQHININTDSIIYVESCARMIKIHSASAVHHTYVKLNEIERKLPSCFVRCHQSFLVNMRFISGVKAHSFILRDAKTIPISQSRYKRAFDQYTEFVRGSLCQL